MRARGTLAVFCVLFGTTALVPFADAAERATRGQKQVPSAQSGAAPGAARAQAGTRQQPLAAVRQGAGRQAPQASVRPAQVAALRQAPRTTMAQGPRTTVTTRQASAAIRYAQPRQAVSQPPLRLVSMGVVRGASARSAGTPIYPVASGSYLSCVPFARMATGMDISGDARAWWFNAAGVYDRGARPERGSVLAFAGSRGMPRGHVAVVSRVVDSRTIEIDHSNWGGPGIRRGSVMRGVTVVDASDRNDWSAVRVQVGYDDSVFGRTYSTHGFIYNRAANGRGMMSAEGRRYEEVAESAAPHAAQHLRLTTQLFGQ